LFAWGVELDSFDSLTLFKSLAKFVCEAFISSEKKLIYYAIEGSLDSSFDAMRQRASQGQAVEVLYPCGFGCKDVASQRLCCAQPWM